MLTSVPFRLSDTKLTADMSCLLWVSNKVRIYTIFNKIGKLVVLDLRTESFVSSSDYICDVTAPTSCYFNKAACSYHFRLVVFPSRHLLCTSMSQLGTDSNNIKCSVTASFHCWKQLTVLLLEKSAKLRTETCSEGGIKWCGVVVVATSLSDEPSKQHSRYNNLLFSLSSDYTTMAYLIEIFFRNECVLCS
jgi:hypothetical protein